MARTADYNYDSAFDPEDQRRRVAAVFDEGTPPPPPTEDHPMVAFAKNLLAPLQQPYEVPLLGAALRGADIVQRSTIDAASGLYGIGLQKGAEMLGGGRGREEQAVTSAVTSETDKIQDPWLRALATPLLYAAGASEAKRKAQEQANLPSVQVGPVKVDLLDVAEMALPVTGLIGAAAKGPKALRALRGAPTPKGEIGTLFDAAQKAGATPEQAFAAASDKFGLSATRSFFETGNDIFIAPTNASAKAARQIGVAAGREGAETIEQGSKTVGEAAQRFDQGQEFARGNRAASLDNPGVNLDKIDAPKATKDYIQEVADANAGFVDQRRGVVTIAETNAAAAKLEVDIAKYAHIKPGQAMNAEQLVATRGAMIAKGDEVTKLQEIVALQRSSGVVNKETQLQLLNAAAEHQVLQRTFAGARAESGRALRIQREVGTAIKGGDVNGAYTRASEILGEKNLPKLVDRLQRIWTDPSLTAIERDAATYRFVQSLDEAKFFDKMDEYWINAILSNPTTHIVNVTGQLGLQLAEMVSKTVSAGVEAVSTVGGLRRPRERFFSEAFYSPFGAVAGLGDGFRRAGLMLKHGIDPGDIQKFKEGGKARQGQALEGTAGDLLNLPTRILGAEDKVFYGIGYSRGLYEMAARTAAKEGVGLRDFGKRVQELVAKPTDEMRTHADAVGRRAGLRSAPDAATSKVLELRDVGKEIGGLGTFRPLKFVAPFINTPVQLVKIGAEYSPLGFVKAITAQGGDRSDAVARAVMGSTAMGFLAQQHGLGIITGAPPQDQAERDAFYASGKIPYAVKIGDKWIEYGRMEPLATPLKWTATAMDLIKKDPNQPIDVLAGKIAFSVARSMEDATYFSAISDLIDALQDPAKAEKFLARIATGFIPAVERNAVQSQQEFLKEPKGMGQQIAAVLPGLDETVPDRIGNDGQPVQRTEGKQGIAAFVSPANFQTERADPETAWISKYNLPESRDANGTLLPARSLGLAGVAQDITGYKLSQDEANRYKRYAGQATVNLLRELKADKLPYDGRPFSSLPYEDQVRAIRKTVSDARETARAQVADEILGAAAESKNAGQAARGAVMRMSTLSKARDRAYFIEGLQKRGLLSGEVIRDLDAKRHKDEPRVAQQLKDAPLIHQYLQTKPYVIGNPAEWKTLVEAKKFVAAYAKANPKPQGMADWQWAYGANPGAANLVRKYSYEWTRSPKRAELLRRSPQIKRYVD